MPKPTLIFYVSLLLIHSHFPICNGVSLKGSGIEAAMAGRSGCSEKLGECMTEPEMESESSRRILAMQTKYISYGTLKRDSVPCGTPGASYYNCHAVAANPYNRGCEVITGCAREHDHAVLPSALQFKIFRCQTLLIVERYLPTANMTQVDIYRESNAPENVQP